MTKTTTITKKIHGTFHDMMHQTLPDIRTRSCSSGNISICETFLLSPIRDRPNRENIHKVIIKCKRW